MTEKEEAPFAVGTAAERDYSDEDISNTGKEKELTAWEIVKEEAVHLKWRILILCCFLPLGSYAVYDLPGAIGIGRSASFESLFSEHDRSFTNEMNQALYSVYSWPNMVLAFGGGILIDNVLGLRKGLMLFTTLVLLGQAIFNIGVWQVSYPTMLAGRFVFGLGGESLSVAQSAYVARWFRSGRGMALAFGITISFSRVGSSLNFLLSPRIAKNESVPLSVGFGTALCILSFLCCIALVIADKYGEDKKLVLPEEIKKDKDGGSIFRWEDVKILGIRFWIATALCVTVYCSMFPFIGIVKNFFEVKYGVSSDTAGTWTSAYQFTCAGGSTVIGLAVDKTGRFAHWMLLAALLFTGSHAIFWLWKPEPIAMMMLMGVAYSFLAASLWPAVPYVLKTKETGIAFGVMTALQNSGLAIWPLISGAILDAFTPARKQLTGACFNYSTYSFDNDTGALNSFAPGSLIGCANNTDAPLPRLEGYDWAELFFMCTAGVGVALAVWLFVLDKSMEQPVLTVAPDQRPLSAEEAAQKEEKEHETNERRRERKILRLRTAADLGDRPAQFALEKALEKQKQAAASFQTRKEGGGNGGSITDNLLGDENSDNKINASRSASSTNYGATNYEQ